MKEESASVRERNISHEELRSVQGGATTAPSTGFGRSEGLYPDLAGEFNELLLEDIPLTHTRRVSRYAQSEGGYHQKPAQRPPPRANVLTRANDDEVLSESARRRIDQYLESMSGVETAVRRSSPPPSVRSSEINQIVPSSLPAVRIEVPIDSRPRDSRDRSRIQRQTIRWAGCGLLFVILCLCVGEQSHVLIL